MSEGCNVCFFLINNSNELQKEFIKQKKTLFPKEIALEFF